MKDIKFRGVDMKGALVYGDLSHFEGHVFIDDVRVKPESVRQLAGYDAEGKEIYEGDEMTGKFGETYYTQLVFEIHNAKVHFENEIGSSTPLFLKGKSNVNNKEQELH